MKRKFKRGTNGKGRKSEQHGEVEEQGETGMVNEKGGRGREEGLGRGKVAR